MKKMGVFLDVSNLYYCIGKKYPDRKLDYRKYKKFIMDLGEISQAIAYGSQISHQASGFIYCLKQLGFTTKFKTPKTYMTEDSFKRKSDWDVGIAMDIVNMSDRLDMVILGTADGDMLPVVEWCRMRGISVVVIACGISKDLRDSATQCIEIPESLLEVKRPKDAKTPEDFVNQKIDNGELAVSNGDLEVKDESH